MVYSGPVNPDPGPGESRIIIYGYIPSLACGVMGVIAHAVGILFHGSHLARYPRTRLFEALILFGSVLEEVGYIFRILSHYQPFLVINFVIQYFMIVCAPVFFAAALYLSLGLIVNSTLKGEQLLPVSAKLIVPLFLSVDVICTVLQVTGAALIGASESAAADNRHFAITSAQANDILLSGLAVQVVAFFCFLVVLFITLGRVRHHALETGSTHVIIPLILLFFTSLFVFLRTTFRLAETAQGLFSFASTHEVLFGVLELFPIVLVIFTWGIWPIGEWVIAARQETIDYREATMSIQRDGDETPPSASTTVANGNGNGINGTAKTTHPSSIMVVQDNRETPSSPESTEEEKVTQKDQ
ncbi:hypothetical protein T439DRAFT_324786 [Meredithblackwellia eburnea MCA 4105]